MMNTNLTSSPLLLAAVRMGPTLMTGVSPEFSPPTTRVQVVWKPLWTLETLETIVSLIVTAATH